MQRRKDVHHREHWATRLTKLGTMTGQVCILTTDLSDPDYVIDVLSKRPKDIFIVAHVGARAAAEFLKHGLLRPGTRYTMTSALLISPETVWILISDFGKTHRVDSGFGMHFPEVYQATLTGLFERAI